MTHYQTWWGSLFTYFFAQCWIPGNQLGFDRGSPPVNWWQNSRAAALTDRQFCIDNSNQYKTYSDSSWGLTACFGPTGYNGGYSKSYGAPPLADPPANSDGTVSPYGAGSCLPFFSEDPSHNEAMAALRNFYNNYPKLWGIYGLKDAFNLGTESDTTDDWYTDDYVGIDSGPLLIMIENYRSNLVWKYFSRNAQIKSALKQVFQDTVKYIFTSAEEDESTVPLQFSLEQNYPNPFNPSTSIKYTIGVASGQGQVASAKLVVYDLLGREVAVLVNEGKAPGSYEVNFDARRPGQRDVHLPADSRQLHPSPHNDAGKIERSTTEKEIPLRKITLLLAFFYIGIIPALRIAKADLPAPGNNKVAYYVFDSGGPDHFPLTSFTDLANIVVLFEGTLWELADSAHYNSGWMRNVNYHSYSEITQGCPDPAVTSGVKVLMNVDDAASWSTSTPFTTHDGTKLNGQQFAAFIKACAIDSLHLDGISLDIEHKATANADYMALLKELGKYFGPLSADSASQMYIAAIYSGGAPGPIVGKSKEITAHMNFVMDMAYFNRNYAARFNQWADSIGASKVMVGVLNDYYDLAYAMQAATWQPVSPPKAGVMVYAANNLKSYTDGVFGALTVTSAPERMGPEQITLLQNYPNPFNPVTTIKYTVGGAGGRGLGASKTMLVVYDVLGRQVATLVDEVKAPGSYTVQFDGERPGQRCVYLSAHGRVVRPDAGDDAGEIRRKGHKTHKTKNGGEDVRTILGLRLLCILWPIAATNFHTSLSLPSREQFIAQALTPTEVINSAGVIVPAFICAKPSIACWLP